MNPVAQSMKEERDKITFIEKIVYDCTAEVISIQIIQGASSLLSAQPRGAERLQLFRPLHAPKLFLFLFFYFFTITV